MQNPGGIDNEKEKQPIHKNVILARIIINSPRKFCANLNIFQTDIE